jgi:predicted RNase H-like HicB family nuclease
MNHCYSIFIQWSEEDRKYVVSLPEFGPYAHTHGETYAEALKHGEEVLELLIEEYQEQGRPLPQPLTVVSHKVIAH